MSSFPLCYCLLKMCVNAIIVPLNQIHIWTLSPALLVILIGYIRPREMDIIVNNEWKYKSVCNFVYWCDGFRASDVGGTCRPQPTRRYPAALLLRKVQTSASAAPLTTSVNSPLCCLKTHHTHAHMCSNTHCTVNTVFKALRPLFNIVQNICWLLIQECIYV